MKFINRSVLIIFIHCKRQLGLFPVFFIWEYFSRFISQLIDIIFSSRPVAILSLNEKLSSPLSFSLRHTGCGGSLVKRKCGLADMRQLILRPRRRIDRSVTTLHNIMLDMFVENFTNTMICGESGGYDVRLQPIRVNLSDDAMKVGRSGAQRMDGDDMR